MQDNSFFHHGSEEPVAKFQPFTQPVWRADNDVQRKLVRHRQSNPDGLVDFIRSIHHDQQIDIAVRSRVASGVRTEQDDPIRIEPFRDLPGQPTDHQHRDSHCPNLGGYTFGHWYLFADFRMNRILVSEHPPRHGKSRWETDKPADKLSTVPRDPTPQLDARPC